MCLHQVDSQIRFQRSPDLFGAAIRNTTPYRQAINVRSVSSFWPSAKACQSATISASGLRNAISTCRDLRINRAIERGKFRQMREGVERFGEFAQALVSITQILVETGVALDSDLVGRPALEPALYVAAPG